MGTRVIEPSVAIDAPPTAVREALADGSAYPEWNPFITHLEGELAEGKRLIGMTQPPWKRPRTFRPLVTACEEYRHLAWEGHRYVPRLFTGYNEFRIDDRDDVADTNDDGDGWFIHRETFTGLLAPLLVDETAVERGFVEMNEAPKGRVEESEAGTKTEEEISEERILKKNSQKVKF